ncbi:MAG: hypothetical protein ACK46X_08720 [Candidatus Sericytochromatia bacterium]
MRLPSLALVTLLALSGCALNPAAINALATAAAGTPNAGPSAAPSPAPRPEATEAPASPATPASSKAVEAFRAKVEAANGDARAIAKLFIAGLVAYEQDATLGRALMTLTVIEGDLVPSADSPSGFAFFNAREIYFRTLDRNPKLGRAYLDQPASGDAADVEAHVMIDDDYAAVEKGVNEAAGTAKFYMKLNEELGAGKRPRPLSLKRVNGAWRVSEYSSVMVQI